MTGEQEQKQVQLSSVGRALVLGGGVVLVVAGIVGAGGGNVSSYINSPLLGLGRPQEGLLGTIAGLISLLAVSQLKNVGWAAVTVVLGVVIGGLGGALILIGGVISLIAIFLRASTT